MPIDMEYLQSLLDPPRRAPTRAIDRALLMGPPEPEPEPAPGSSADFIAGGMLPSPKTVGGWLGDAASALGGGGVGNYKMPSFGGGGAARLSSSTAPHTVTPPRAIDRALAKPISSAPSARAIDRMIGVRSGSSSSAPDPARSITRDAEGRLVSSGAVPRLSPGQVPDSVRSGAFEFSGQGDFGQNTPDVSLAGMNANRRARALLDARYQEPQARDLALRQGEAETTLKESEARDPYGLRKHAGTRAIDAAVALDQQAQERDRATTYLRGVDAQIDSDEQQQLAGLKAQGLDPLAFKAEADKISGMAAAAKSKVRQDYAIASGKVTTNFTPDRSAGLFPSSQ